METGEYVLSWGCLAMLTSIGAQALRRSGLVWLIFALFAGPVATFCLMFAGKAKKEGWRRIIYKPAREARSRAFLFHFAVASAKARLSS